MISWLGTHDLFPDMDRALREPNGLLAAGADLSPARLLMAYRRGIFPWYSQGEPILWWSPDPRMVLEPAAFKVSRSLAKRLRRQDYEVRVDTAFETVMRTCAETRPGQHGSWIGKDMIAAYVRLHHLGHAHSVETWMAGKLVGGLYGIAIGRMFYGESMFTRATDASKIAMAHLCAQLHRWEFGLIDCQMETGHLASLGARTMDRRDFLARLTDLIDGPDRAGKWSFDDDLII
jgi:leucyl/phenylalanyl-tRNA---protein transferase